MRPADPELQPTSSDRRPDRAERRAQGDQGDKGESPVSSDATGVRETGGVRVREDAKRPRRRYITY